MKGKELKVSLSLLALAAALIAVLWFLNCCGGEMYMVDGAEGEGPPVVTVNPVEQPPVVVGGVEGGPGELVAVKKLETWGGCEGEESPVILLKDTGAVRCWRGTCPGAEGVVLWHGCYAQCGAMGGAWCTGEWVPCDDWLWSWPGDPPVLVGHAACPWGGP